MAAASSAAGAADLISLGCKARASSILSEDKRSYGPQNAIDGDDSSCWNSEQGLPQWLELELGSQDERGGDWPERVARELFVTFQGGFAGTTAVIEAAGAQKRKRAAWAVVGRVSFVDSSSEQATDLRRAAAALPESEREAAVAAGVMTDEGVVCRRLRVRFEAGSDFFGRVVVYGVRLTGARREHASATA